MSKTLSISYRLRSGLEARPTLNGQKDFRILKSTLRRCKRTTTVLAGGISEFHVATATENPLMGTLIVGQSLANQTYTTTDGEFDNCINAPGH